MDHPEVRFEAKTSPEVAPWFVVFDNKVGLPVPFGLPLRETTARAITSTLNMEWNATGGHR